MIYKTRKKACAESEHVKKQQKEYHQRYSTSQRKFNKTWFHNDLLLTFCEKKMIFGKLKASDIVTSDTSWYIHLIHTSDMAINNWRVYSGKKDSSIPNAYSMNENQSTQRIWM